MAPATKTKKARGKGSAAAPADAPPDAGRTDLPEPAAEWVGIDDLEPWAENPRHNDEAAEKLAAFLRAHGGERAWTSPIAAQAGSRRVIAGHTRLKAARLLGLERVPVRYLDVTDGEAEMLALADNKLGEQAAWDEIKLKEIALRLPEDSLELAGFDLEELQLGGDDEEGGSGSEKSGAGSLAERFLIPPFSVLDARQGVWQERKRAWLSLGIQSELGRGVVTWHMNPDGTQVPHAKAAPGGSLMPTIDRKSGKVVRSDGRARAIAAPTGEAEA